MGKAGRVSHVLPLARPFVSGLYGALTASRAAARTNAREAPPGQIACRRFHGSLRLFKAILTYAPDAAIPLHRDVHAVLPQRPSPNARRIEVDASPWGGGGVLFEDMQPTCWFAIAWHRSTAPSKFGTVIGDSAWQTFYENLALYISVLLWALPSSATLILGDNTGALQEALDLKGRGPLLQLSRELSVLRARRSLWLHVSHLYGEANTAADALSRLEAPEDQRKPFPAAALGDARESEVPPLETIWAIDG